MIVNKFKGYLDGIDITKVPKGYLAYPSKNVFVHKGTIYTRKGITLLGQQSSVDNKVHSAKVWKTAKSAIYGEIPLRVIGNTLQAYLEKWRDGAGWVDVFDGFDSNLVRVEFAEWIDTNTNIIKARLIMVDGSENIYQWNGGIAVVDSVNGNQITIKGTKTLEQLGFDDGSSTTQTVTINGTEYTYSHNPTSNTLTLDSTPSGISQDDLIIVKPLTHSSNLSGFEKDHIFNYKGHLVIASLDSVDLYFSDVTKYNLGTGFDFTVPPPNDRTPATPMFFTLDGKITAMHERKGVLWVSTIDDWFKIKKLYEKNAYDEWATVEKVESAMRKGALPFAVSAHKNDMIFIAQDKTVLSISDLEVLQTDQIKLISDDVEGLLNRLDLTEARIYYHGRYIYVIVPQENIILILDAVEGYWQPPQLIPIQRLSVIDGELVGHSNTRDESFYLFKGDTDLGADIQSVISLGYFNFDDSMSEFDYKKYKVFGLSGYISADTKVVCDMLYEMDGSEGNHKFSFDGNEIKKFRVIDDASLGKHPFGTRSWAGGDFEMKDLARFYIFDRSSATPFLEFRPQITVTGSDFRLTAISVDIKLSKIEIKRDLFIKKD